MTVTASIKEHTSLFWGDIPQSAFLRTSTCCPPPSACTEAHRGAGHPPVLQRWSQGAPRLLQKVLSEIPQLSEHRQEALGLATALSFVRKPCAIQGPGFPNSTQQQQGYAQAEGMRHYAMSAQQPKCLANKLCFFKHPFVECRNSELRLAAAVKQCQKGMRYSCSPADLGTTSCRSCICSTTSRRWSYTTWFLLMLSVLSHPKHLLSSHQQSY